MCEILISVSGAGWAQLSADEQARRNALSLCRAPRRWRGKRGLLRRSIFGYGLRDLANHDSSGANGGVGLRGVTTLWLATFEFKPRGVEGARSGAPVRQSDGERPGGELTGLLSNPRSSAGFRSPSKTGLAELRTNSGHFSDWQVAVAGLQLYSWVGLGRTRWRRESATDGRSDRRCTAYCVHFLRALWMARSSKCAWGVLKGWMAQKLVIISEENSRPWIPST
jgi:hypothetical protein